MALKKVLFVFPQWHFNIVDTLKGLSKKFNVHTLNFQSADEIQQLGKIDIKKIKIHNLKLKKVVWLFNSEFFFPSFSDLWKKLSNYDVIIFKNIYDPSSLAGMLFCRLKNTPFIVSEQKIKEVKNGIFSIPFFFVKNFYLNWVVWLSNVRVFSPTKIGFDQLKKYTRKRFYIPFAIDVKEKPVKIFDKNKKFVGILNISKFQERKDQLCLLKSLKELSKSYPNIKFKTVLIGGFEKGIEYLSKLQKFASENNLNVEFVKKVAHKDVDNYFLNSDIFVLSSYDEPAAYSHLEAMAYGLPVICSDENGTQNYIEKGVNGAVFKARDTKSLTKELKSIIISKGNVNWSKIEKFGKKSREIAVKNHSPEVIVKLFERMLND